LVQVLLLPLEESVFPVVLLEGGKALDVANTKIDNNGIHAFCGEVTKPVELLCYDLTVRGLRLVVLLGPHVLGVLNGIGIHILHLGVFGFLIILVSILIPVVVNITVPIIIFLK
jgi:hypothetical protein